MTTKQVENKLDDIEAALRIATLCEPNPVMRKIAADDLRYIIAEREAATSSRVLVEIASQYEVHTVEVFDAPSWDLER